MDNSTELIQTLGVPAFMVYLAVRDLGPIVLKKLRNGSGSKDALSNLDKGTAVLDNSLDNLEKKFDEHAEQDLQNFYSINQTLMAIQNTLGELKGLLRRNGG